MPPKKDPTTTNNYNYARNDYEYNSNRESNMFNNNVTVNLVSGRNNDAVEQTHKIKASPQILEAIKLSQSFFNRENTETAISMIKGSAIVQENALEMRNAIETFYHAKVKQSKKNREEISTASQKMKEQMILAGASGKHKAFEAVLQLVFEADQSSIEYLTSFHAVLGKSLQHSKLFSERVNVDMKRTRLLKRALNEVVDGDIGSMNEFGDFSERRSVRSRGDASPGPTEVYLGNSEDERTAPSRRLNSIMDQLSGEEGVDVAGNAIHRARNTLRGRANEDNGYDSEATERQPQGGIVFDTRNVSAGGFAIPQDGASREAFLQARRDNIRERIGEPRARPLASNNAPPVTYPPVDLLDLNIDTTPATDSTSGSGRTDSSSHAGVGYSNSSPALPPRTTAPFVLYGGDSMGSPALHTASTMTGESFPMDADNDSFTLSPPMPMRPAHRAQQQQPANTGSWADSIRGFLSPSANANERNAVEEDVQLSDL